jgi:hypothetical protein
VIGAFWLLEKRADARIVDTQVAACGRVNILRTQVNTISHVIYDAFESAYVREDRLARTLPESQRAPHVISAKNIRATLDRLR